MKTLRVMLPLLLLLLSLLGFTRSVASPLGSSLDDSTKTYTNATTTLFPMVVAATIRKQKHQQQQQQQGNQHHEEDSILGKMRRQGLDVLGAKLLRPEQEEDDDFFKIHVHILLHDDDDGQVLTNLLLGEQDVLDYHVVVPKEDQEEHVNTMKNHLRQSPRNLQQQQTKQQQYETINKNRFQCYRTVEGTLATLQDLASNDTKLASYVDIGSSYEKTVAVGAGGLTAAAGYPIRALRITGLSKNKQKRRAPQVLLTAGLHAREYAPPELLTRLAETLLAGYGVDADITWILNRTVVHIVPLVNPDGRKMAEVESSPGWRKNTHRYPGCARSTRQYGVDLNRQFPFAWGDDSGSSSQSCSTQFRGPEALSEPESDALALYAASIFPKKQMRGATYQESYDNKRVACSKRSTGVYVDVHAFGGQVYYPWGYADTVSPNDEGLRSMATKLASFGGYGLWGPGQPDFLYPVSGDTSDFMYGHHCAASFGFEIGTDFYETCNSFQDVVVPENIQALILAAKVASAPFVITKGPDVMDMTGARKAGGRRVTVTATVSDSARATAYDAVGDHGLQNIASVCVYVDVHPYDAATNAPCIAMTPVDGRFDATTEAVTATIENVAPGKHTVYVEAKDALGHKGPVSAVFV